MNNDLYFYYKNFRKLGSYEKKIWNLLLNKKMIKSKY